MEKKNKTEVYYLAKILPWLESLAIVLILITGVLMLLGMPSEELFMVSMGTLAIVYFNNTRIPVELELPDNTALGFRELMAYMILPKIMWLGAAVAIIGILFHVLKLKGAMEMVLIGGGTLVTALAVLGILFLAGTKELHQPYRRILPRILPVAIAAIYLLVTELKLT